GGWVLPYFAKLGADLPPFDFRVSGVTSISVDLHKYAYCAKGVSVLLHASAELRRPHFFASAAWPGYTMLNPTLQSTRSGGPLAAAWAVVHHLGEDGYLKLASRTREAVDRIRAGVASLPGLRVLGDPVSTLVAFAGSDGFDLFTVADEMKARGWYVQPQFAHGTSPLNLHLTVTAANHGSEPEFLADLAASVEAARTEGPVRVDPDVAAFVAALDPATLTSEQFGGLLAAAGLTGAGGLPERMAPVNALLAVAPEPLRERLLVEFLGALYTPSRD
ncbi:aspartate aminotransferase family protein, partial [Amycolatopsis sp. NPDC000673]